MMGYFRFRRTFKLLPGLRLNINKKSISASVGVRGAHFTLGTTGTRATVGLPGTGLSYTEHTPWGTAPALPPPLPAPEVTQLPAPRIGPWGPRIEEGE